VSVLLGVVMVLLLGGMTTPRTADSYIGESLVESAGKLTTAAEKVVKSPGSLPEMITKSRAFGGTAEANSVAGVFQKGKVLPLLGGWLSFEAGYATGKEICNMFSLGWCMSQEVTEAVAPSATWAFRESPICSTGPAFAWQWGSFCEAAFYNTAGNHSTCGVGPLPAGATFVPTTGLGTCGTGPEKGEYSYESGYAYRYGVEGRTFGWSGSDTEMPNYSYTQPSEWPNQMATAIGGTPESDRLGQYIASQIEGSGVADPYVKWVEFPDGVCHLGAKVGPCVSALQELDLVPDVKELDWDEAVVEELDELDPEKTREEESEKIIVLPPLPSEVKTGTPVEIESNPKRKNMPIFLPLPDKGGGEDGEGEDPEEYTKRIAPIFIPNVEELDDGTIDPKVGPGRVSKTHPGPRQRFDPNAETKPEVDIQVNPDTAPRATPVPGAPGGWAPPSVPSIDFGPLAGVGSPCTSFPFGLFCWMGEAFGQFDVGGQCPEVSLPVWEDNTFDVDGLCSPYADQVMSILRPIILFAFIIGMGFLFARGTRAIGGD
jgi:hypothetical protein